MKELPDATGVNPKGAIVIACHAMPTSATISLRSATALMTKTWETEIAASASSNAPTDALMLERGGAGTVRILDCIALPTASELAPQSCHLPFQTFDALEGVAEAGVIQRGQEGANRCEGAADFPLPWGGMAGRIHHQKLLITDADIGAGAAAAAARPTDKSRDGIVPGDREHPVDIVRITVSAVKIL
ncbi:hypothetical protein [Sphingomonas sp. TREG-RG-20F-R18-01]|uniref:hypothetical protein n=1 Tax=Sphingomonas sp. TREG-RG-20F-R18-01 TaxID=2914982 RepID=UPI001F55FB09|nr:hypothetical protein [Sphingomonas sp. TREG-RG-20F-R18-01]